MRLKLEQINHIKELSSIGISNRKICQITGLNLTTIGYHCPKKDLGLVKEIKSPDSKFTTGEIIGAFAGDGYSRFIRSGRAYSHLVSFYLSYRDDIHYAEYLYGLLKKMNLNPRIYQKKFKGEYSCIEITVGSVRFIEFIKSYLAWEGKKCYNVRLRNNLKNYDNEFLIGFARGLMDTDGFVESHGVGFGVVSESLILNFKSILDKFAIMNRLSIQRRDSPRKDLYLVRIPSKGLIRFSEIIGFSNQSKIDRLIKILNLNGAIRI